MDYDHLYSDDSLKIQLEPKQLSVAPGETVTTTITLENLRDIPDYLEIRVLGLKPNWVTINNPKIQLPPNGIEKITIHISPPSTPDIRVGHYPFTVQVLSQIHKEDIVEATGSLTVAAVEYTGRIGLLMNQKEFSVIPGGSLDFNFTVVNNGNFTDDFRIVVAGVPTDWVQIYPPVVHLSPGEQKEVKVTIKLPKSSRVRIGHHRFSIQIFSSTSPDEFIEVPSILTIAMYEATGRIGVLTETVNISAIPGESATFQMVIINRGLKEDQFRLAVDGIPVSWVAASASTIRLKPGEEKRIMLSIQPPKSPQSKAGRHPFSIRVISQEEPGQMTTVDFTLTVGVFSEFKATLQPEKVEGDEYVRVLIENLGNYQQTFTVSFPETNPSVIFEPQQPVSVTVNPGEVGVVVLQVAPRTKPLIGGSSSYNFQVKVSSPDNKPQILNGVVYSKGLIPIWIVPLVLLLCLGLLCLSTFVFAKFRSQDSSATKTAYALQTLGSVVTQGAITPSPTWIPITNTLLPSQLPPTNTNTVIPGTPTLPFATVTPTFTFTSIPLTATLTWTPIPPTDTPIPTEPPTATSIPTDTPIPSATPTPIPDFGTGNIAFTSNRDGNAELYSMNTQSFAVMRLTVSPGAEMYPAWSPDYSKLAYTSNIDGNFDIYIMNADGTNIVKLTTSPATDQFPTWSPDGQWIAFSTDRDGNLEIYKIRVDGSELVNLTNNPADDTEPNWFTTGGVLFGEERILFTSNRDGNQEIYMMKSDGSDQVNITNSPSNEILANGSPDGNQVLFVSDRDGNLDVYRMLVDGTQQVNLTNNPAKDTYPSWSPDQRWVAFSTSRDGKSEIYAMKPDGSELFNMTKNPADDVFPAW